MNSRMICAHVSGFLAGGVALFAGVLIAAEEFPLVGGDLASDSDWGGTCPAATADVLLPEAAGATYTLGADKTFNSLTAPGANTVLDFLSGGNHKLTLTSGNLDLADGSRVSGGVFDFGGKTFSGDTTTTAGQFRHLLLADAKLQNMNLYVGNGKSGAEMTLSNVTAAATGLRICANNCGSARLNVVGGSRLTVTDNFYSDVSGANSVGVLNIAGKGTVYNGNGTIIGGTCRGHEIRVTDGAVCSVTKVQFGNAVGGNLISVGSGGTFCTSDYFYLKNNDNRIVVTNGTFASPQVRWMSNGNTIEVVNGRLDINLVGNNGALSNALIVAGAASDICLTNSADNAELFSPLSTDCRIVFDDGACFTNGYANGLNLMKASQRSRFVIRGGAVVRKQGQTVAVGAYQSSGCISNRLEVLDGGELDATSVRVTSRHNALVVSNATVTTRSTGDTGVMIGYMYNDVDTGAATNCMCLLQGTCPRLNSLGLAWLHHNSVLRYEIPAEGYADGFVPFTAKKLYTDNTANRLEIDCSAFHPERKTKLVLMRLTDGPFTDAQKTWVAEQAKALPEDCSLTVTNNDRDLVFTRKGSVQPFIIFLR